MTDFNYCSILSKKSNEPLAGTAPYAKHFVFITWPKKYWQYDALEAKGDFPKGLKKWMKEQKGPKVIAKKIINRFDDYLELPL